MPARVKNAWTRILEHKEERFKKFLLNVVHNSRDLWFLALDCWVDDVDKGAAAATDHLEYIYDT